jgi:hypothetical protein
MSHLHVQTHIAFLHYISKVGGEKYIWPGASIKTRIKAVIYGFQ